MEFRINGCRREVTSARELGPDYKEQTSNLLEGIMIKTGYDESPVSAYESRVPHITVPGMFEFGGLHTRLKVVVNSGLPIYVVKNMSLFEDILEKQTPNLFGDMAEKEILELFKKSDPSLLGLAVETLRYYHPGRIYLEKDFKPYTSPPGFSGHEYNGMLAINRASVYYPNNPFSEELTSRISEWFNDKGDIKSRQKIELEVLNTLSNQIRNGFKFGNRLGTPRY